MIKGLRNKKNFFQSSNVFTKVLFMKNKVGYL